MDKVNKGNGREMVSYTSRSYIDGTTNKNFTLCIEKKIFATLFQLYQR